MKTIVSRRAMLGNLALMAGTLAVGKRALSAIIYIPPPQPGATFYYPFNFVNLNNVVTAQVVFAMKLICPVGTPYLPCLDGVVNRTLGITDISSINVSSAGNGMVPPFGPLTLANLDLNLSDSGNFGATSVSIVNGVATLNSLELYLNMTPGVQTTEFCQIQSGAQGTNIGSFDVNAADMYAQLGGTWEPGPRTRD
jgi:hypothetical protein